MTRRPSSRELAARWKRRGDHPWIFGHRGARLDAPENTLLAFDLAMDGGADGVELDVRLDRNGRIVVIHDPDLTRVTDGRDTRAVEAVDKLTLSRVDVGSGMRVPSLTEALRWAAGRGARLNVELKEDVSDRRALVSGVCSILKNWPDAPERVLLSSFHPGIVRALARRLPDVAVAWLLHGRQRLLGKAVGWRALGIAAVHPENGMASRERIDRWRALELAINVWTVNDAERARALAADGADGIITDRPRDIVLSLGESWAPNQDDSAPGAGALLNGDAPRR